MKEQLLIVSCVTLTRALTEDKVRSSSITYMLVITTGGAVLRNPILSGTPLHTKCIASGYYIDRNNQWNVHN